MGQFSTRELVRSVRTDGGTTSGPAPQASGGYAGKLDDCANALVKHYVLQTRRSRESGLSWQARVASFVIRQRGVWEFVR
jgi:hypothetical protein